MSNRLSCLGALAAFIVAALLTPFSRVAGSKGNNFYLYDFCIMKCKMALLLSAFAFAPSVLAEVPVVTLSVDNIQVRAEWRVVGSDKHHFDMVGNVLMLRPNISGAGKKPNGATITANVEVLDKFSDLNPLYEDLTVSVKITTVVMGCHANWTVELAQNWRNLGIRLISIRGGKFAEGYALVSRSHTAGYTFISGISNIDSLSFSRQYIAGTTPDIWSSLLRDVPNSGAPEGWTEFTVNEHRDCFDDEVADSSAESKNIVNTYAPLISGLYAGAGIPARTVTVANAKVEGETQVFWLDNVTLGGLLDQPTVIAYDGKAFIIDDSGVGGGGSRYEYFANNATASVTNSDPHGVVFLYEDCPPTPGSVTGWLNNSDKTIRINFADIGEATGKKYVRITYGEDYKGVYKFDRLTNPPTSGHIVHAEGLDASGFSTGPYKIEFSADHFLCD